MYSFAYELKGDNYPFATFLPFFAGFDAFRMMYVKRIKKMTQKR